MQEIAPPPVLLPIKIVLYDKRACRREVTTIPMRVAHFDLSSDVYTGDGGDDGFASDILSEPIYYHHPVVAKARADGVAWQNVKPIALYTDGVAYTKRDSFIGFFFRNLRTGVSKLAALIRKEDLCVCGCRGWCTYWFILAAIKWDFDAGASGVHALAGPLGVALNDSMAAVAGEPSQVRVAILEIRADWPAWTDLIGVRQWSHKLAPCPCCDTSLARMFSNLDLWVPNGCPFNVVAPQEYLALCNQSSKFVVIADDATRARVARALAFKRKFRGRGLVWDFPELRCETSGRGLAKSDRLEPSLEVPDVARFEHTDTPFLATFFVNNKNSRVLHHSPVMHISGVSTDSWSIDILHCWHLGPEGSYVGHVFFFLLRVGFYTRDAPAFLLQDDLLQAGLLQLKSDIWRYYKRRAANDADSSWKKRGSRIWNLTMKMLGKRSRPILNAKGAETHGLVDCAVELLGDNMATLEAMGGLVALEARLLHAAGLSAQRFNASMAASRRTIAPDAYNIMFGHYHQFVVLFERAGGWLTPKFHLMYHCIQRSRSQGNPRFSSTYRDESLNGVIARIARSCHRSSWQSMVHHKISYMLSTTGASLSIWEMH